MSGSRRAGGGSTRTSIRVHAAPGGRVARGVTPAGLSLCMVLLGVAVAGAQEQPDGFDRLRDRGEGLPVSMFGTYIRAGEFLVYPFFEYYRNSDEEYKPSELGFVGDEDLRGKFKAREGLIFLAYGLTDYVAVEFEFATIAATLWKSPQDGSAVPARLHEFGVGDVEGQLRWRWNRESDRRPEFFSYFEAVAPVQRSKALIGTPGWEFKLGTGLIRGLPWGTITVRGAMAHADGTIEPGEYALEYLRRVSKRFRFYGALEGTQDEVALIAEGQVFLAPNVFLKLNNSFGVTSKASDWAPEVGLMVSFR